MFSSRYPDISLAMKKLQYIFTVTHDMSHIHITSCFDVRFRNFLELQKLVLFQLISEAGFV